MPRLSILWFVPLILQSGLLQAEDHWVQIKSGPFQVWTAAGDKAAREEINQLEQFGHALGTVLGQSDLHLDWPLRVIVYKNAKQMPVPGAEIALARDAYVTAVLENEGLGASRSRELARMLIAQNTQGLPANIRQGLSELFSTLAVSGTHVTLGAVVAPNARTRDWARMHLLNVDPAYAGRARVLVNNLQHGSDLNTAYQSAFEKSEAQIEKQLDGYMAAGVYGTTEISALPLNPARDLHPKPADEGAGAIASADLLLASGSKGAAEAAYKNIKGPAGLEGQGLIALSEKKPEASKFFADAVDADSKSARAYFEAAMSETHEEKELEDLQKACDLNPWFAEPVYQRALLEDDLTKRIGLLKKAIQLDPHKVDYWQLLAKNLARSDHFAEAQKAWAGAEHAATTPEERAKIRAQRSQLQGDQVDTEAADRKRALEEEAADLKRVRDKSMAAIHAAEVAADRRLNPNGEVVKPVEWMDATTAPAGTKVAGELERFDCMGATARLAVKTADGKVIQIAVADPKNIVLPGGGEQTLACGPQKPPRKIKVIYKPRPDKRLGTAGDAVSIEFH